MMSSFSSVTFGDDAFIPLVLSSSFISEYDVFLLPVLSHSLPEGMASSS